MTDSLRLNTRRTYNSGQKRYLDFCNIYQLVPMPATEDVLLLYVSYLYRQGLSYNTIQVYLYSIRSLHIFHGYNNPLQHCLRLNQIVKAVHISSGVAKQKLPITVELLRKLQPIVSTFNNGSMLWTAMLLAFFGCLRASEFTVNSSFSPSVHLSIGDVSFSHIDDHPYAVKLNNQKPIHLIRVSLCI